MFINFSSKKQNAQANLQFSLCILTNDQVADYFLSENAIFCTKIINIPHQIYFLVHNQQFYVTINY